MRMIKCDACGATAKPPNAWTDPKGWTAARGAKMEHLCGKCSGIVKAAIVAAVKKIKSRK